MFDYERLRTVLSDRSGVLVVVGMGYVGFPAALVSADAGYDVIGIDVDTDKVESINAGVLPFRSNEVELEALFRRVRASGRFRCAADYSAASRADAIIIAVQTPVSEENKPTYEHLKKALESTGNALRGRTSPVLVVVESTISPGTTSTVVRRVLQESSGLIAGDALLIGHCPERVTPGKVVHNLRHYARVIGGDDPVTAGIMYEYYRNITDGELDVATCATAELVKTAENSFRDMQIAFSNLLALVSDSIGASVGDVIRLVNKVEGRNVLQPGCGVGGHCLPKDPWLMVESLLQGFAGREFIAGCRELNESMPAYTVGLVDRVLTGHGIRAETARVLVLGASYLANSDDLRHSPALRVIDLLASKVGSVVIQDPYVEAYCGDVQEMAVGADLILVTTGHSHYRRLNFDSLSSAVRHRLILDTRQCIDEGAARSAGFVVYRIGELGVREESLRNDR